MLSSIHRSLRDALREENRALGLQPPPPTSATATTAAAGHALDESARKRVREAPRDEQLKGFARESEAKHAAARELMQSLDANVEQATVRARAAQDLRAKFLLSAVRDANEEVYMDALGVRRGDLLAEARAKMEADTQAATQTIALQNAAVSSDVMAVITQAVAEAVARHTASQLQHNVAAQPQPAQQPAPPPAQADAAGAAQQQQQHAAAGDASASASGAGSAAGAGGAGGPAGAAAT